MSMSLPFTFGPGHPLAQPPARSSLPINRSPLTPADAAAHQPVLAHGPDQNEIRPAPANSCVPRATATPPRLPRSDHVSVMKVYFLRRTGKLVPRGSGGFEVSGYSDWECLARWQPGKAIANIPER